MSQFQHTIDCAPDFALLSVTIPAGETLKVEAAAMATMDTNIEMKTKMKGGLGRLLTGENLFLNEFTAQHAPGLIRLAPAGPADIRHLSLEGSDTYFLSNSAFLASTMGVEVETKWNGMIKGFFSGAGLFLIRASGRGDLWFNSYGAIIEIEVDGDYLVDNDHIVAFSGGLSYEVERLGGYKSLFFGGEGLVCRFSGQGTVWIQTRKIAPFLGWINPFRPTKSND